MDHGSAGYFAECARFERRLSVIVCVVSAALFAPLVLSYAPLLRDPADRMREDLRFGVRGDQERYVKRIRLEAEPGLDVALHDLGRVISHSARRGGDPTPRRPAEEIGRPEFRPPIEGPGESFENLLARALARRSDIPVVPPDQLVIEKLVRPIYPEDARERNIEGRVSVLALVDTMGAVVNVDVVGGSVHDSLVRAAVTAVWQCRFQPYRVQGQAREVYVVMPFNFTIY